jgi:hypothetical protein
MTKGFDFDFVDLAAKGRYADEADFVQLVVPVVAHEALVEGATFCSGCNRVNENRQTAARPRCLLDSAAIHQWPFFMTIEHGTLLLSPAFVDAALELGLKGWIHGETLDPWPALPDPVPARPPLRWARPAASADSAAQHPQRGEGKAGQRRPPTSVLDRAFAENWLAQLHRFLKEVAARGGKTSWTCGVTSTSKVPANTPEPLRVLLDSCGGKLSFRYEERIEGRRIAGSFDLDAALLGKLKAGCRKWAKETWIAEYPEEQRIWLKAFPFAELRNGDFLALDGGTAVANPAVVRLRHDDSSEEVSPSLGDFLTAWQESRYADFDDWETSE